LKYNYAESLLNALIKKNSLIEYRTILAPIVAASSCGVPKLRDATRDIADSGNSSKEKLLWIEINCRFGTTLQKRFLFLAILGNAIQFRLATDF
jgi:hypothetical protein